MPRTARVAPGGLIYHVLNRGVGKTTLFRSRSDFEAFLRCLIATQQTTPMRLLAYCVMNNHWHLVLWPRNDGDLARFMLRLTTMHVRRWLINRHQVGTGHVYQGRYKSFAIQDDGHLATACRYVERNPVRVKAVKSSADWDQENGSSLIAWPWHLSGHGTGIGFLRPRRACSFCQSGWRHSPGGAPSPYAHEPAAPRQER